MTQKKIRVYPNQSVMDFEDLTVHEYVTANYCDMSHTHPDDVIKCEAEDTQAKLGRLCTILAEKELLTLENLVTIAGNEDAGLEEEFVDE